MNFRKTNGFFVKLHLTGKNADPKVLKWGVCLVFNYCFLKIFPLLSFVYFLHIEPIYNFSCKYKFSYFMGINILCMKLKVGL